MSDKRALADYFVEYVPEECRTVHEVFARTLGYFWLPCPLCGTSFGGHEWRDIDAKPSTIPDPESGPGYSKGICPACTRAGRGERAKEIPVIVPLPASGGDEG